MLRYSGLSLAGLGVVFAAAAGCSASDAEETATLQVAASSDKTVAQVIGPCNTSAVLGLARQLLDEVACEKPGFWADLSKVDGVELTSAAAQQFPYVANEAAEGLRIAIAERRESQPNATLKISSPYRTLVQQYALFKSPSCGTVATPGGSRHESGIGIDLAGTADNTVEIDAWKPFLEKHGWDWLGDVIANEWMHFDYIEIPRDPLLSVKAFQRLWNRNHPEDWIKPDGIFGPQTEERLRRSPANGFPNSTKCGQDIKTVSPDTIDVSTPKGMVYEARVRSTAPARLLVKDATGKVLYERNITSGEDVLKFMGGAAGTGRRITLVGKASCAVDDFSALGVTCRFTRAPQAEAELHIAFSARAEIPGEAPIDDGDAFKTYAPGPPITCPPFTYDELLNPSTKEPYKPGEQVTITDGIVPIWTGTSDELLALVNSAQEEMCKNGQSLRDSGELDLVELAGSGKLIDPQRSAGANLDPNATDGKLLRPLDHCPLLTLGDLGLEPPKTGGFLRTMSLNGASSPPSSFLSSSEEDVSPVDRLVDLGGGLRLRAGDLRDRINEQQRTCCKLGYDFVSGVQLQGEQTLRDILAKREAVLATLGISPYDRFWNLASSTELKTFADAVSEIQNAIKNRELPSPETLQKWAQEAGIELPVKLQIPDVPSIPSPSLPKRKDLALLKRKTWDGFNLGKQSVASIYSNAWLEVRGSEKSTIGPGSELDVRGEGKAGAWVMNREFNLVYGEAVFNARPNGVAGKVKVSLVGQVVTEKTFANPTMITFADIPWSLEKSWEHSYDFAVGPIPVHVEAGVSGSMSLGYKVGAELTRVYGEIRPAAEASVHVRGGIGTRLVSAGAEGHLDVLQVSIPVVGNASLDFQNDLPYIHVSVTGDVLFSYLSGRMSAYAQWPWLSCSWKGCRWKKKRATRELFAWDGERGRRRILNWGMDLFPFGATMSGDLVDQADRDELAALQEAGSLQQLQEETAKAEMAANTKMLDVFNTITADLRSDKHARVALQMVAFRKSLSEIDQSARDVRAALAKGATP